MTNETHGETFALETRVEELTYLSGDRRVRRGESDRLEVGSGPAQDIVSGTEHTRIGGTLSEHTGGNLSAQASRMETTVEGKLTQHFKSNTTLLGGAMTEVYTGGVFIGAGMSDDLVIGGGVRVTAPADLWLCGLIGMEEKVGSACADGALLELYRLAFEREYATGVHAAGAAVFSGTVHATLATGFRQLFKVSRGVRDLTPGGNAEGGDAPAPPAAPAPAPAPGGEAASGGMLMAQGATGMEDAEDLAALEDIRHLFGDLDTTVDSGRTGDRAALLEDLGSLAKYSETGEDVGDAGALANRLQEGAGLSDVVDAEDLRAMLGLDESPETLDEARLVPDEVVDSQMLDDDGNWVERGYIDPVEPEVHYEHLLGPGSSPDPPDRRQFEQHGAALGIPEDYDFELARIDFNRRYETEFRANATPGTSELRAALDDVDDMVRRHAGNLPSEWIGDLGLSADELEQFSNDPMIAYLTMTEMEASARESGDIAKADFLQGVLNSINAQSNYAYEKAIEAAEALRLADNMPLANDVDQPALVRAIQERLAALEAKRAALDPIAAKAIAQCETEHVFLNVALRRVKEGYDPGPRLQEMVLIVRDRNFWQISEASDLKYISDAYRNVLDMLDDFSVRAGDLPSIDDVRQFFVGTSSPTGLGPSSTIGYPGEELTDHSNLSRHSLSPSGSSDGAGSNALFTDTDDAIYDTSSSDLKSSLDLRNSLDIRLDQLDREESSVFDELYNRYNRKRPLEDTSGTDESDPPPPKRPIGKK